MDPFLKSTDVWCQEEGYHNWLDMFWSGNLTQYLMSPECLMSSDWFKISMAHLWSRNSTTWQYSDFNLLSQLRTSPISAKHSLHFTHISLFTSYAFNLQDSWTKCFLDLINVVECVEFIVLEVIKKWIQWCVCTPLSTLIMFAEFP